MPASYRHTIEEKAKKKEKKTLPLQESSNRHSMSILYMQVPIPQLHIAFLVRRRVAASSIAICPILASRT